jgi:hypothetical protein
MDVFIKRIQTRASRQGVRVSKPAIRELYNKYVANPALPTEVEMSLVLGELLKSPQSTELAIPEPEIIEITPDSHPDVWETLQPPTEEPTASNSSLTAVPSSTLTDELSAGLTQRQIQSAVEQHFGKESVETKQAILNYVAQDTFATATELRTALTRLREMKLEILMKIVLDHNQASGTDQNLIQSALTQATQQRQEESRDFFNQFENQLAGMKAAFGL